MQLDKCIPARKWDTTLRGQEQGDAPVRFRGRNDIGIGQHEKVRQGEWERNVIVTNLSMRLLCNINEN